MSEHMEEGPVLRLLLKDIKAHEDEQIEALRKENSELRALRDGIVGADRWERYFTLRPVHANREIVNGNKAQRSQYEQELDLIAAEG